VVFVPILALNLLKPLANVKQEAAKRLRAWLSVTARERVFPQPIPYSD